MPDIANLTISGRLCEDPRVIPLSPEKNMTTGTIACAMPRYVDGEWTKLMIFLPYTATSGLADRLALRRKGDWLILMGVLQPDNYINRDGIKIEKLKLYVKDYVQPPLHPTEASKRRKTESAWKQTAEDILGTEEPPY